MVYIQISQDINPRSIRNSHFKLNTFFFTIMYLRLLFFSVRHLFEMWFIMFHCFQFYSMAIIAYRVATFNDCVEAADELKVVSSHLVSGQCRYNYRLWTCLSQSQSSYICKVVLDTLHLGMVCRYLCEEMQSFGFCERYLTSRIKLVKVYYVHTHVWTKINEYNMRTKLRKNWK